MSLFIVPNSPLLASFVVEDLTATISLPNPFLATNLHVDWGDGTVQDITTLSGATGQPQTFTYTYAAAGEYDFAATAIDYDSVTIPDMPVIGTLTVTPSEVTSVEAALTPYNLSGVVPFVDPSTLIWDDTDGGTTWNTNEWNAVWVVECEWKPDEAAFPTAVPCFPFFLDDGTINVTIIEFDDPSRNEYPGTLTFTVEETLTRSGVASRRHSRPWHRLGRRVRRAAAAELSQRTGRSIQARCTSVCGSRASANSTCRARTATSCGSTTSPTRTYERSRTRTA